MPSLFKVTTKNHSHIIGTSRSKVVLEKHMFVLHTKHTQRKINRSTHFVETLEVLLWDIKGALPSLFKVTTKNHSHIIRNGRSKVVLEKHMFVSHTKHTQQKINKYTSFAIDNMYYINFRI